MTFSVFSFLAVLLVMIVLFLWSKLPYEMVAFAALLVLFGMNMIDAEEMFMGFSSSAVVIFITTFFVAGALKYTGVTNTIAGVIAKKAGTDEARNVIAVMLIGATVSAFMSNVAAVALLLPTVVSIGHINRVPISRLMIPLAFSVVLGGLLTLIGTTANIVSRDLQRQSNLEEFGFFDFTPFGICFLIAAIIFMAFYGRKLLPKRNVIKTRDHSGEIRKAYGLNDELFYITLSEDSPLIGQTLAESRIGMILGVRVVAIKSGDNRSIYPKPDVVLNKGDRLLVYGSLYHLEELLRFETAELTNSVSHHELSSMGYKLCHFKDYDSYQNARKADQFMDHAPRAKLRIEHDQYRVVASRHLREIPSEFHLLSVFNPEIDPTSDLRLDELPSEMFFKLEISDDSGLIGEKLNQVLTVRSLGFKILGIERNDQQLIVDDTLSINQGDHLICIGEQHQLKLLKRFAGIKISIETSESDLVSSDIGVTEVVLSPRSSLIGKSLVEIEFREKYDYQVLAIWREGKPIKGNLAFKKLNFGDALLLQGPISKMHLLDEDQDFLLLGDKQKSDRRDKAKFAVGALAGMILLSAFEILPLQVACLLAAVIVVLTGAIKIDEAYQEVSWKVVFLVAALLPIGIAFQNSGAATYLSNLLVELTGGGNILFTLFVLAVAASIVSQTLDVIISIILVGQLALSIASRMNLDHEPFLMTVTIGASFAFLTPFSHKASLLVMGAGGYRVKDYFRVGSVLTVLLFSLLMLLVPLIYGLF